MQLHKGNKDAVFDYELTWASVGWAGTQYRKVNFLYRFQKLLQIGLLSRRNGLTPMS